MFFVVVIKIIFSYRFFNNARVMLSTHYRLL